MGFPEARKSIMRTLRAGWGRFGRWFRDSFLDRLGLVMADILKIINSISTAKEMEYWLVLCLGAMFLVGGFFMHSAEERVLAPAFISVGASIMSIYLANYLQKSTSTPRMDWALMVAACNASLVAYLLELNGDKPLTRRRVSYNREFRTHVSEEKPVASKNLIKLDILIRKRKINRLIDVSPQQLKRIRSQLEGVIEGLKDISADHGRPVTNREFNKDFARLQSELRVATRALKLLEKGTSRPVVITDKKPKLIDRLLRSPESYEVDPQQPEATVSVHQSWRSQAEASPDAFWAVINLLVYLKALICFVDAYGHGNNSTVSLIVSGGTSPKPRRSD